MTQVLIVQKLKIKIYPKILVLVADFFKNFEKIDNNWNKWNKLLHQK